MSMSGSRQLRMMNESVLDPFHHQSSSHHIYNRLLSCHRCQQVSLDCNEAKDYIPVDYRGHKINATVKMSDECAPLILVTASADSAENDPTTLAKQVVSNVWLVRTELRDYGSGSSGYGDVATPRLYHHHHHNDHHLILEWIQFLLVVMW
jgi:hypothetical protein